MRRLIVSILLTCLLLLPSSCLAEGITFVGDSLMVGAEPYLREEFPSCYVNAEIGRQVYEGTRIIYHLKHTNSLYNTVVISLGTNGEIDKESMDEILMLLGKRSIIWVNNYCPDLHWQDANNAYLNKLAEELDNFTIIDWYSYALNNEDIIRDDNVHPTVEGYKKYADLIIKGLR